METPDFTPGKTKVMGDQPGNMHHRVSKTGESHEHQMVQVQTSNGKTVEGSLGTERGPDWTPSNL